MNNSQFLTLEKIQTILNEVSFRDWELQIGQDSKVAFWLQWRFWEKDLSNPEDNTKYLQECRKWRLSPHMSASEVINTAYLAAKIAVEHEFMEQFKIRNKVLYNPHQSVYALLETEIPIDIQQNVDLTSKE